MVISTYTQIPSSNIGTFEDFSEAWIHCLQFVMKNGGEVMDGAARLRESLNVSVSTHRCTMDHLIAAGANEERIRLMKLKYSSRSVLPQYKISYGGLFRSHFGVDQIRWLTDRLASNNNSKSATIGFHVPGRDELSCISLLDCKMRDDALHMNAVFRSQNVYASQPGNAYALSCIQREMAKNLQVSTGVLTLHVLSAHIYETDWSAADEIISNNSVPEPCGRHV